MPKPKPRHRARHADAAILAEIRRVARLLPDGPLTVQAFDRLARINSRTATDRFRGWENALAKAGLARRYSRRPPRSGAGHYSSQLTDAQLLREIRRVARKLGTTRLGERDMLAHGRVRVYIYSRRFGSWSEAVLRAGLEPASRASPYTAAELAANLRAVWLKIGGPPHAAELSRPPSRISWRVYAERFGTFSRALAAFVAEAEGGPPMARAMVNPPRRDPPQWATERAAAQSAPKRKRTRLPWRLRPRRKSPLPWSLRPRRVHPLTPFRRRAVPLALRYMVLERDRFRCAACGASPAIDAGCRLHVDHIVPVARGGETLLGNLQTLCADCNRGKGAGVGGHAGEPAVHAPERPRPPAGRPKPESARRP
jgi:5-methylcytosine-specific restriction endonuclease McrA